jgi:hypothetical protein
MGVNLKSSKSGMYTVVCTLRTCAHDLLPLLPKYGANRHLSALRYAEGKTSCLGSLRYASHSCVQRNGSDCEAGMHAGSADPDHAED